MNWVLILMTASGLQQVGLYDQQAACTQAAKDWQSQGVKAGCVQQESPERAMKKIAAVIAAAANAIDKQ